MITVKATGIEKTIRRLREERRAIEAKMQKLLERLAEIGIPVADMHYGRAALYAEDADVQVYPMWLDDTRLAVCATGSQVLFLEFGAGATFGANDPGVPKADAYGYGPGTWSDNESLGGKGHWQDPNGWWYERGKRSLGNPAFRSMYYAAKEMRDRIKEAAREVFV